MKRAIGYPLFILILLIYWGLRLGLPIFGIYYIIKTFTDDGIVAGLISIPLTMLTIGLIEWGLDFAMFPFTLLLVFLLESDGERPAKLGQDWFQRHLNWTVIMLWVLLFPFANIIGDILGISVGVISLIVPIFIILPLTGWALNQKNRSLWWLSIFIIPFMWLVFLSLKNRSLESQKTGDQETPITESQEEEYQHNIWEIYRKEWATASPERRTVLNKRMLHWQELIKNGWTASKAYIRVAEEESGVTPQLIHADMKTKAKTRRPVLLVLAIVIILSISFVIYTRISTPTPESTLTPASSPLSEPPIPAHYTTYTDEAGLFSISYPPGWELDFSVIEGITEDLEAYLKDIKSKGSLTEAKLVFFAGVPWEKGHNPNVKVIVGPSGERKYNLEDLVEIAVEQGYKKDTEEYQEFSRTKTVVDGREAIILDFDAKYPLMDRSSGLIMFIRDDTHFWAITCGTMPPKDFSDFESDFHAIVKSLRILK